VTDLCDEFDLILGNSFLAAHKAVLNYERHCISLTRDGRKYSLKAVRQSSATVADSVDSVGDESVSASKLILNFAQATRCIRNGCESFFVLVHNNVADPAADDHTVIDDDDDECTDGQDNRTAVPELAEHIAASRRAYADVFAEPSGLPPDRGVEHVVPLVPDAQPEFKCMCKLSPAELEEVNRQVTDLLLRQLIEPSTSPWSSPILFVKKKDGSLRMVVDYRALNKLTVKNRYPLPRIDDLFDKLHGAKYFSSLDAASGFHQILLKEEDRPKTAFRTPFGHYQFRVLPFGLTNAPATFQAVMNKLFSQNKYNADGAENPMHILSEFVLVFINDILIFSKTAEEHKKHIDIVLQLLREHKILIKPSKCVWGQTELPYLGHIVGQDGIKPDPKKIQAVVDWPRLTTVREVQQFLGLTNFFKRYVQGYSQLTAPLTDLTRKNVPFIWEDRCAEAFAGLKQALTTAPVLVLPDPKLPYELITDSCGFGIGAVLMQEGRPVAFYSRKMTKAEMNYVNHEQELLAVIASLKVFRCYLLGDHLTLVTDNMPNTYLDTQPTLSRRQARWSEYLQRYNFTWVHRPGKQNVADPLSRNPSFKLNVVLAVVTRSRDKPAVSSDNTAEANNTERPTKRRPHHYACDWSELN